MILAESEVTNLYRNKLKTIRVQRCMNCNRALAMEVSDNIGYEGEYWIIDSAIVCKGESEHYFKRSGRWFGNLCKCPTCGREGRLPIDKPLNWEQMEKSKEGNNAVSNN